MLNKRIAIVVAKFNKDITQELLHGALAYLKEQGCLVNSEDICWVPGAVEVPLIAQQYARLRQYDAIITFAAIIKGETDHYDYVCRQVSEGCQQVSLQHNIPVIFGVLTTPNKDLALARIGGNKGHHGRESAAAAISMVELIHQLSKIRAKVAIDEK